MDSEISSIPSLPKFREVPGPPPQQYWVIFENLSDDEVELYYDNGRDGILQGKLPTPGSKLNIGTYVGHQFFFRKINEEKRFFYTTMESVITHIVFRDEETVNADEERLAKEKAIFIEQYKKDTGIEWLHMYPRPKPGLFMYPCKAIGDIYEIISNYTYYHCYPESESEEDHDKCRASVLDIGNHIHFEWEVLSTHPKILRLSPKFLSEFETEHIKDIARPELKRSVTGAGGHESTSRTSSNAWIKRSASDVLDWIFRRLAQVIQVPESHLWDTIGSESIQVVHYVDGQQYKAHHDWRVNRLQTRFATFLIYLSDKESDTAGGETEFPRIGLKVHPGKGKVIMFYDLLEDGNVDDLTKHAALPVTEGEKWLANVWIWDPNFS